MGSLHCCQEVYGEVKDIQGHSTTYHSLPNTSKYNTGCENGKLKSDMRARIRKKIVKTGPCPRTATEHEGEHFIQQAAPCIDVAEETQGKDKDVRLVHVREQNLLELFSPIFWLIPMISQVVFPRSVKGRSTNEVPP